MKCPHKHQSIFACNVKGVSSLRQGFQTCPHAGWSSCLSFVFQHHPPLSSVAGATQGGLWGHPTLLQTPAQCLRWKKGSMVTQGTEMDIPQEKMSNDIWLQTSLVVLVYPRFLKKGLMLNWWKQGDVVWLLLDVGTRHKKGQHWKELILPELGVLKEICFFPILRGYGGKEPKPSPKSKCSYRGLLRK